MSFSFSSSAFSFISFLLFLLIGYARENQYEIKLNNK